MATSYGSGTSWRGFLHNKTANVTMQRTRAPANHEELFGMVLSINKNTRSQAGTAAIAGNQGGSVIGASGQVGASGGSTASSFSKPQMRVVLQLGCLDHDRSAVLQDNERVRVFPIQRAKNITADVDTLVPKSTERVLRSYERVEFNVAEGEVTAAGGIEPGDIVLIHGIRFNYWFSKNTGKVLLFCNVDKISSVPGAHREGYAYDLLMAAQMPVRFMEGDKGAGDDGEDGDEDKAGSARFMRRLGKEYYALNVFNTADDTAYTSRAQGEIYELEYTEREDPTDSKIKIVTFRPDVFNSAAGAGFIVQNGLKTIARGLQWKGANSLADAMATNKTHVTQVWLRLAAEHIAPLCIVGETDWKTAGRFLLSKSKYTILVRENLESTSRESHGLVDPGLAADHAAAAPGDGGDDVDFKLVGSVQIFLCNVGAEIRRLGIPVPSERLLDAMAAVPEKTGADVVLSSVLSAQNFHSRSTRRSVINLNEYAGNLSELIRLGNYEFFVVHTIEFEPVDLEQLALIPPEKRYLLLDHTFASQWRTAIKQPDKLAVLKRYGVDPDLLMTVSDLIGRAISSRTRVFYAVLKEDVIKRNYLESDLFQRAVRSFVTNPDATIAALTGGPDVSDGAEISAKTLETSPDTLPDASPNVVSLATDGKDAPGGTKRAAPTTNNAGAEPAKKKARKEHRQPSSLVKQKDSKKRARGRPVSSVSSEELISDSGIESVDSGGDEDDVSSASDSNFLGNDADALIASANAARSKKTKHAKERKNNKKA